LGLKITESFRREVSLGERMVEKLLGIDVDHQVIAGVIRQDFLEHAVKAAAVGRAGQELEAPLALQALQRGGSRAGEADGAGEGVADGDGTGVMPQNYPGSTKSKKCTLPA